MLKLRILQALSSILKKTFELEENHMADLIDSKVNKKEE
jgi:hypothetical protein